MRVDGRNADQPREVSIVTDFVRTAAGSCLIATGNTRVICTASVEETVPPFLKGKGQGWITAEYAMLPASTGQRKKRDGIKKDGRSVEIQRLIGRSLRMAVDLESLTEKTLTVDCDVIDADGGTRCAGITGAAVAVALACRRLELDPSPFKELVAAVSVGIIDGTPMLDLCYEEDSRAEVDMNVVMTESGKLIEIQGTAEDKPFDRRQLNELLDLAEHGLKQIFEIQRAALEAAR